MDAADPPEARAWIRMIREDEAEGALAEMYARMTDPSTGRVDHVLRIHSLDPESLDAHVRFYRHALHGPSGVSRAEREMIGVVVSGINGCHY